MTQTADNSSPSSGSTAGALASVLACPACRTRLEALRCGQCGCQYPLMGNLPWLLANPQAQQAEWRNRWHLALRNLQQQEGEARQASTKSTSTLTRTRLLQLADASAQQRQAVQTLLASLELGVAGNRETYLALQTTLPEQHRLFSYAPNVFRDWCWGEVENRAALDAIQGAAQAAQLAPAPDQRVLVLGSGAGRLAHDLHALWQPELTLGVELNPYLALIAAKLSAGETLKLYEFPFAPRRSADVACMRTLQKPKVDLPPGLEFIIADALSPPLLTDQFDVVVSPWFTDVCGAPVAELARLINSLLTAKGNWLNHGSVVFNNVDPAACLSLEEFQEQACNSGFELTSSIDCTLPYLQSPSSRHGRVEQVNTSCFRKHENMHPLPPRASRSPQWLLDLNSPVPQSNAFRSQAQATAMHAFIMSLIDGKRSIATMAEVMEARGLLSSADAQQALRGFFEKMQAEANGQSAL